MNIKQAMEQIKNVMTAYCTKDEFGGYPRLFGADKRASLLKQ